jgi:hypothetical protein
LSTIGCGAEQGTSQELVSSTKHSPCVLSLKHPGAEPDAGVPCDQSAMCGALGVGDKVGSVMSSPVQVIYADATLASAKATMTRHNTTSLLVSEGHQLMLENMLCCFLVWSPSLFHCNVVSAQGAWCSVGASRCMGYSPGS